MATREEIYTAIRNADAAGDTASVQKLGAYLQTMDASHDKIAANIANDAISQGAKDPTQGMSTFDKVAAGAGKAVVDLGRGLSQLNPFGGTTRADVAESRTRDAPLMATGAAQAGNVLGNVAMAVPTFLIPGAASLRGAAAIGAGQGLLQPSTSIAEKAENVGLGGAAGAGGVAAGKVLSGLYQGGKALAEPFYQAGREKIAGRVIQRFADNPNAIASATGGPSITGAVPTIAEATGDAGMARLQDAVRSVDPQIAGRIDARLADNNAARVGKLNDMAGDDAKRKAAMAARTKAAAPEYQAAFAKAVDVDPQLQALLKRPSVQQALARASNIAQEEGRSFGLTTGKAGSDLPELIDPATGATVGGGVQAAIPPKVTGQTLQDLKMGMDALLKDPTSGIAGKEAVNVKATRDALVQWMENAIPEFNTARTSFAAKSAPLNQMDVASEVLKRGASPTSDLAGNQRLMPNALTRLMQDGEGVVEKATGRKGLGDLSKVMEPDQQNMLNAIVNEVDRTGAVARAGNGPGSATAQRMAAQNILRQLVGPTGLPVSWAESALANTVVGKPLNLLYGGVAEPKIQQALAEAVLDPTKAKQMLLTAQKQGYQLPDNAITRLLANTARAAPASTAVSRQR